MKIRIAQPGELDTVVRLRDDMKAELGRRGLDQWQVDWPDRETMIRGFRRDLDRGNTWFAEVDGEVVGMVTANTDTAEGLWSDDEIADALFVHRLTRAANTAVRGTGAVLLKHVDYLAADQGRGWLRLDAWTNNSELHAYYRRMGFRDVGIVPGHHTPSAARFERPVRLDTPNGEVDLARGG